MKPSTACNCLKAIALIEETHKQHVQKGMTLKEKLKQNRSESVSGHGEPYWDSVVRVVEEHYKDNK